MKGIKFSDDLIPLIADGSKTMIRRLAKFPKDANIEHIGGRINYYDDILNKTVFVNPIYRLNELLYVKETFMPYDTIGSMVAGKRQFLYKASFGIEWSEFIEERHGEWCSPNAMTKLYARLFLRITNVRAERLQDITPEDCIREGIKPETPMHMVGFYGGKQLKRAVRDGCVNDYAELWNSIYLKRDNGKYSWENNPYVFVYEFSKIDKNEVEM